jgi:RNA polymerase sigma-70 factor (ECF subfamily)
VSPDDPKALFESWLAAHAAAVWKIARAYTHAQEDRQDLAQEILLQCWRSLPQFAGRASMATWFYRIALNTALSWRRSASRRAARRNILCEVDGLSDPEGDVVQNAAHRELLAKLYDAIRQLSATDAALLLLHLDDLPHRQIAEILGITENNVGVKLNRAKQALTRLMQGEAHDL